MMESILLFYFQVSIKEGFTLLWRCEVKIKKFDDRLNILINGKVKKEAEKILEEEGSSLSDYVRDCIDKKIAKSKKLMARCK